MRGMNGALIACGRQRCTKAQLQHLEHSEHISFGRKRLKTVKARQRKSIVDAFIDNSMGGNGRTMQGEESQSQRNLGDVNSMVCNRMNNVDNSMVSNGRTTQGEESQSQRNLDDVNSMVCNRMNNVDNSMVADRMQSDNDGESVSREPTDGSQLVTHGHTDRSQLVTHGHTDGSQLVTHGLTDGSQILTQGHANGSQILNQGLTDGSHILTQGLTDGSHILTHGHANGSQILTQELIDESHILTKGHTERSQTTLDQAFNQSCKKLTEILPDDVNLVTFGPINMATGAVVDVAMATSPSDDADVGSSRIISVDTVTSPSICVAMATDSEDDLMTFSDTDDPVVGEDAALNNHYSTLKVVPSAKSATTNTSDLPMDILLTSKTWSCQLQYSMQTSTNRVVDLDEQRLDWMRRATEDTNEVTGGEGTSKLGKTNTDTDDERDDNTDIVNDGTPRPGDTEADTGDEMPSWQEQEDTEADTGDEMPSRQEQEDIDTDSIIQRKIKWNEILRELKANFLNAVTH